MPLFGLTAHLMRSLCAEVILPYNMDVSNTLNSRLLLGYIFSFVSSYAKYRAEKTKRGRQIMSLGRKRRGRPFEGRNNEAIKRRRSVEIAEPDSKNTPPRSSHKDIKYGDMGCKVHNEHGQMVHVAPLDGIPFLSSFSKDSSELLHSAVRLSLQQLELFTLSPELMKSAKMNGYPRSVGIRCRGCIADRNGCCFIRLSSVGSMFRELHLMVTKHLFSCRYMSAKDAKAIQEWMEVDPKPIADFCRWIARLYSMEDSSSGGVDSCVVWGDSPKVLGGYCFPADVNIGSLLGEPIPELEEDAPSATVAGKEAQSVSHPSPKVRKKDDGPSMASSPRSDSSLDGELSSTAWSNFLHPSTSGVSAP